uniref:Magnesium transporter n=1 Tax=Chrysotila carterae TaxID=13221 RepID=A0A7S4BWH0_CHRCT
MQPTAVFLIPLGCLSSASGLLLMRSAKDAEGPMYCSPRWLLGFFLLGILATMFDVIVLALLPLSVLAPFAGLTIVFSLGLARTGLFGPAEHLSFADIISTTLVLLGVTLVSAFGPHSDGPSSLSALTAALTQPVSVVFAVLSLCVAGVQLFDRYTRRAGHKSSDEDAAPSSFGACLASSYAAASCGTISRMMLKLVASSLSELPSSMRVLLGGGCMLAVSAPLHLRLLNAHLASADASLAIPFYLSFLILLTTASGGLIFGEFATVKLPQLIVFGVGVAVATAGLVGLSHKAPDTARESAQHNASAVPSEVSSATSSDEAPTRPLAPRASLLDRTDFSRLANGMNLSVAFSHTDMRALGQVAPRAKSMPELETHVVRPMRSVKRPERATTRT